MMAEPSSTRKRQDARRAASSKSKPYTKKTKSISPSSSEESPPLPETAETSPDSSDKVPSSFPTHAQYKRIEANYIASLSPRKRDKALITQAMFDNIWDVLHDPDTRVVETPQFRFWVRKMFTLSDPQSTQVFTASDSSTTISSVPVVLHENRPVAIREQLYELFVYCHGRSNHGGRDKTCAVIRQHYSWVPKELTAQFVKICPTCTLKRSGNPDLMAMVQERQRINIASASTNEIPRSAPIAPYFGPGPNEPVVIGKRVGITSISLDEDCQNQNLSTDSKEENWSPNKGPLDSMATNVSHRELSPMLVDTADVASTNNRVRRPFMASPRGLKQPPAMSREVSLFNGIPHGWTIDGPESIRARAEAYNAMVDERTGIAAILPPGRVPRIPSVVFKQNSLFTPDSEGLLPLQRTQIDEDDMPSGSKMALPPLKVLEDGTLSDPEPVLDTQIDTGDSLPLSLRPFKVPGSRVFGSTFIAYMPEIDPTLLDDRKKDGGNNTGMDDLMNTSKVGVNEADTALLPDMPTHPFNLDRPILVRRMAAPSPLELTSLRSSSNFTTHRDSEDSSPTTPCSTSSCYSQLSFQTGSTSSTDPSPFATALPTPIDEHQKTVMELTKETDGLVLAAKDISVADVIQHPWEQDAEFPTMLNLAQEAAGGVVP